MEAEGGDIAINSQHPPGAQPGVIGNLVIVKRHLNMATQYRYLDIWMTFESTDR